MMSRLCRLIEAVEVGVCEDLFAGLDLCKESCQFGAVKLPLKRRWMVVGKFFVQGQPEPESFQVGKVIGCQDLPLDDREVDFQ